MATETKRFPLRVLLTVTTDRLLTKGDGRDNGIGDLYAILDWMTNDSNHTHQLPRVCRECKPWLWQWFPQLKPMTQDVIAFCETIKDLPQDLRAGAIDDALMIFALRAGAAEFDVPRIPADDHERKHHWDELVAMRGSDEGIVVVDPQELLKGHD